MTLDVLAVEFRDGSALHIVAAGVNARNELDSRTVCDSLVEPSSIFALEGVSVGKLAEVESAFIECLGLRIEDDGKSASAVVGDLLGALPDQPTSARPFAASLDSDQSVHHQTVVFPDRVAKCLDLSIEEVILERLYIVLVNRELSEDCQPEGNAFVKVERRSSKASGPRLREGLSCHIVVVGEVAVIVVVVRMIVAQGHIDVSSAVLGDLEDDTRDVPVSVSFMGNDCFCLAVELLDHGFDFDSSLFRGSDHIAGV